MIMISIFISVAPVCASTHEEVHGVARTETLGLKCRFNHFCHHDDDGYDDDHDDDSYDDDYWDDDDVCVNFQAY